MTKKRKYLEDEKVRVEVSKILEKGGIVVIPTDTLYGLSASLSSDKGYGRILELKECNGERNFLLLADSIRMVEKYIRSWGSALREELDGIWPAPMTAIMPAGKKCPRWTGQSIAFRVPAYEPLLALIGELGEPVISTSVNLSGKAPLHRIEEIEKIFGKHVDLITATRLETQDRPSTIVDFTHSKPHLIRQGSYPW